MKYNNRKIVTEDGEFDSKKEYRRWMLLKALLKSGEISDLQRQVKYVLIPTQREPETVGPKGGRKEGKLIEKECYYLADFVYEKDGQTVVEDVKGYRGKTGAYSVFVIKRKLMLYWYHIRVKEV